jgi:hypothetical protein
LNGVPETVGQLTVVPIPLIGDGHWDKGATRVIRQVGFVLGPKLTPHKKKTIRPIDSQIALVQNTRS